LKIFLKAKMPHVDKKTFRAFFLAPFGFRANARAAGDFSGLS